MDKKNERRDFLKKSALISVGALVGCKVVSSEISLNETKIISDSVFTLPALEYGYDALEPSIDKMTMEIHHSKHHQGYVNNLNKALNDLQSSANNLEDICKNIGKFNTAVRNNAGGHYNHSLFWKTMKPNGGGSPTGKIAEAIKSNFESFEKFQELFNNAAATRFGSGWAWLIQKTDGKLAITSTANQDNPLMEYAEEQGTPLMGIDVWEHAYYLKYQNKRKDYIGAWWNVVNWDAVNERI